MKYRLLYLPIALLFLLSFVDCAKKGTPSGGKKDTIPPIILKSVPKNYSTNFTENEIRIYFDEYIKLKNLQKNLIISPPLKYAPTITPLSTSKVIKIKILDTLAENTTYSINFGQSIVDNNEEVPFDYFKYVFSTGTYIDSLSLTGKVTDALLRKAESPTSVVLYQVNDTFNDSLVFSEKPFYITTVNDSTSTFELTNLKAGNYLLLALNEKTSDYTFQSINDKIAFENNLVSLPSDSTYNLVLFKEKRLYKIERPKHIAKNHIIFGYEGDGENLTIELKSKVPDEFSSMIYKDATSDTLHYWFQPSIENDSLLFIANNLNQIDTLDVRMKQLFKDSLKVSSLSSATILLRDTVKLKATIPLKEINSEKIIVIDKDSTEISTEARINERFNLAELIFPKTEEQIYRVKLLPGALIDFFDMPNDTLNFGFRTKATSDFGTLTFNLKSRQKKNLIVQLVDAKSKVIDQKPHDGSNSVYFDYITPGSYYLRIVIDENANGIWDTGNFIERKQPEKIIYYPSMLEVRANWSLNETLNLD